MSDFKFGLEKKVRDRFSGFQGVIIGRSQWATENNSYGVVKKVSDNEEYKEARWLSEGRLEEVSE